jgi:nitronate monooxygenase
VLRNAGVERLLEKEGRLGAAITSEDIVPEVAGIYPRVMRDGEIDAGAWSCGLVAGLIDDIPTVAELVDRIVLEAQALVRERLAGIVDQ